jgi:hypothetical protein
MEEHGSEDDVKKIKRERQRMTRRLRGDTRASDTFNDNKGTMDARA